MSTKSSFNEKTNSKNKEPRKYKVVMYNDDFTPMDFVVYILVNIFRKNENDAYNLMMMVHTKGSAVVGTYTYDMAQTKTGEAMKLARDEGYPFKVTVEKE